MTDASQSAAPRPAESHTAQGEVGIESPATEPRTILVVDDDRDIREGLADALRDEGYVVATASDGAEALLKMRAGPLPRLVLLDLMMPILDGVGFRASQKADPALSAVPVVLITASGKCGDDLVRLNFDGCLAKPMMLDQLFQVVADQLAK